MRLFAVFPLIAIVALGTATFTEAQTSAGKCVPPSAETFRSISTEELQLLIADVRKTNPKVADLLREDPEMRQDQISNLRELLAFASQAVKEGLARRPAECVELRSIAAEVTAASYDREKNKARPAKGAFGYITDANVAAFWGEGTASRTPPAVVEARKARFEEFFDNKVALLIAANPEMKDREVTDEERSQARDFFAKIDIYADEFRKSTVLSKAFRDNVALQVKLQQAQFLARQYNDEVASKVRASDADINAYLTEHPELDPSKKRAKAETILRRAVAGEDFASLANEFSDDPGNTSEDGQKAGGLYADVKAGQMIEAFEKAALSLEPGKVHQELTPTDFGYHIIKLEKKSFGGLTYDVRHILISTGYKDPDNADAREMPLNDYVRSQVEDEKTRKLTERLIDENAISVPDDFEVPTAAAKPAPAKTAKPRARKPVRKRT
jgi:parvulin-like peptidyl-prolyl isomerase